MKILYAVQATGNGHLSRAKEIIPALINRAQVDVLVSGTQAEVTINQPIKYTYKGLSFYFGKNDALFPIVLNYSKFSSTIQQSINYELFYEKKFRIKAELFHQAMNNIPYSDNNFRDNLINEEAVPFLRFYRSNGNHRSIGLELLFQKYFTNKSYSLFSATR